MGAVFYGGRQVTQLVAGLAAVVDVAQVGLLDLERVVAARLNQRACGCRIKLLEPLGPVYLFCTPAHGRPGQVLRLIVKIAHERIGNRLVNVA